MAKKNKCITKKTDKLYSSKYELESVLLTGVALIILFSAYTEYAGMLSVLIRQDIYKVIGILIFVLPFVLFYISFKIWCVGSDFTLKKYIVGPACICISLGMFASTVYIQANNMYEVKMLSSGILLSNENSLHGGILIGLLTLILINAMGYVGSYIVGVLAMIFGIVTTSEKTLKDIICFFNKLIAIMFAKFRRGLTYFKLLFKKKILLSKVEKPSSCVKDAVQTVKNNEATRNNEEEIELEIVERAQNHNMKMHLVEENSMKCESESIESGSIHKFAEGETEHEYIFPSLELLNEKPNLEENEERKEDLINKAVKLEEILKNFDVNVKVTKVTKGPSVTRFELQPGIGVKVSKIVNLQDDISLGLASNGVRIEAPIPGKSAVGVEIPNGKQSAVYIRELLSSQEFLNNKGNIAFAVGEDIAGKCIVGDLSKMPHLLIAGATGSGKSVCINTIIISLLYKYTPDEVKLILVDPKVVELSIYNDLPHLLIPVVTDPKKASGALNWAVNEMNRRYSLFSASKVKNIESYNNLFDKGEILDKLPFIVIVIDELADLMIACANDVENYICRLAQMARAAGMHLIIATQRPSTDVITGTIKANIPSRISFAVSSSIDSRTILDGTGAEKLIGRGDMLYYPSGESKPVRIQGCYVTEQEVESVVNAVKLPSEEVKYNEDIINHIETASHASQDLFSDGDDELIDEAIMLVRSYKQASTSFLQRKLKIGFNRASRLMDELEQQGIISEKDGNKPRKIYID